MIAILYLQIRINFVTAIACLIAIGTFYTAKIRKMKNKYSSSAIK
jgi:hypothetical protein